MSTSDYASYKACKATHLLTRRKRAAALCFPLRLRIRDRLAGGSNLLGILRLRAQDPEPGGRRIGVSSAARGVVLRCGRAHGTGVTAVTLSDPRSALFHKDAMGGELLWNATQDDRGSGCRCGDKIAEGPSARVRCNRVQEGLRRRREPVLLQDKPLMSHVLS